MTQTLFDGQRACRTMEDGTGPSETRGLGLWASTVNVSREPVRSNAVPELTGWSARLVGRLTSDQLLDGALAMRQMDHIVATREGADLARLDLEDFVEVVEYDPVRHMAMVIGTGDAPRAIPVIWLMLRVFPGAAGVAVLPGVTSGDVRPLRAAPRGSFEQAFAIGETMAGSGREGVLGPAASCYEGVGAVLVVPPEGDPADVLDVLFGP